MKSNNAILLDGNQVDISELRNALVKLKAENGVVWYHRENPERDPPPENEAVMKEVLDAIIGQQLPVKLFVKADFSE